jgi:hypothetical protein
MVVKLDKSQKLCNLAWSNSDKHTNTHVPPPSQCAWVHLDGFDASKSNVDEWKKKGYHVGAYISTGSWEKWRPDANDFPKQTIGKNYDGWPGEKWLEIKYWQDLKSVMSKRFQMVKDKGFELIECDNCEVGSRSVQVKDKAEQKELSIAYHKWLAAEAHGKGLNIAWKNTLNLIKDIVDDFDACFNEEAMNYNETEELKRFTQENKPVWVFEYKKPSKPPPSYVSAAYYDDKSKGWVEV